MLARGGRQLLDLYDGARREITMLRSENQALRHRIATLEADRQRDPAVLWGEFRDARARLHHT